MGSLKKYILNATEIIESSPIRKLIENKQIIPFEKSINYSINNINDEFEILKYKDLQPINIVIVGEVKSGKSTLINAIVKEEVSEVDALESTSNIVKLAYGQEQSKVKENEIIDIKIPITYLKKINIVDTPGLRSVTKKNEKTTMDYIQNADIILYNFDSTHLGQEDISIILEKISSYGKPIIGILNKADLVDVSIDELIDYANGEYGLYIDKFFVISAYLEYQESIIRDIKDQKNGIVLANYKSLKNDFNRLMNYIQDVYENSKEIQYESIQSSIESLLYKDMINHYEYLKSITMLDDESRKYEKLLSNKANVVNLKLKNEISDWLDNEFLLNEIKLIKENIEDVAKYINENYINELIQNKKRDFDRIFVGEWEMSLKEVKDEMREETQSFVSGTSYNDTLIEAPSVDIDASKTNLQDLLTTVGTGAIIGGAAGSVMAIYSATVGSSAASMALIPAIGTYCPPLLAAGTISGGVAKLIFDKIKKDERSKEILGDLDLYKENLKYSIYEIMEEAYKNSSRDIVYTNQDIYENTKGIMLNKHEIENISKELRDYVDKIKKTIKL